ncbi:MAG: nickel insertion protein [Spirochaetota bacterium]
MLEFYTAIGGIFKLSKDSLWEYDYVVLLETNIDDMNPEYYELIFEKLYNNGALEVFLTPIIMKKGRPAQILSTLCKRDKKEALQEVLFTETSSIGIREHYLSRVKLRRELVYINTQYGKVRLKLAFLGDKLIKKKPEYDDCRKISIENNIPVKAVIDEVLNLFEREI